MNQDPVVVELLIPMTETETAERIESFQKISKKMAMAFLHVN